uniref:Xylulose kinase-1 n=1 Tax=Tanacetum cinerariifolium TaxID=118510 RepID=A0A6L2M703_TANCI|nr:xylulose kinase-1 [Tanacetum cinerariifolium]
MALIFANTHNMIAYLTKSDASEGFEQILDFLNASVIKYALTVNPTIYVSCIKQFWSSVSIKKTNDVARLQALIDRRKVIITEDAVRQALHLDDTKSRKFKFSKYIFDSLIRNVDSSSNFYMYLRFLQLVISAQVGDPSSHTTKYTSPALTQKVFANIRRVGKGFSEVDTPLFEGMLVPQQAANDVADDVVVTDVAEPTPPSPTPAITPHHHKNFSLLHHRLHLLHLHHQLLNHHHLHNNNNLHNLPKLLKSLWIYSTYWGIIAKIDTDEDVILEKVDAEKNAKVDAEVAENDNADDDPEPAELKKVIEVVTTAKLMTKVVTAAATTITTAPSAARRRKGVVIRDPEETATPSTIVHSEPKSKDKGKGFLVKEPKPLKKQAQVEQDEAYARELEAELNKNINWDDVIEQVKRKEKEDNAVLRYQALKRKPQIEAHARKNMMVYMKNMAGFKMNFFKGMSYNDIRPIFEKYFNSIMGFLEKGEKELEEEASKALKRKSKSSEQQAVKKKKLDEEVKELKTHIQIVLNDEDDVYTKATPLALKVPVVDYQIHTENNKPYYKVIRADGTHQLFLSFLSLLRNFDREDLEILWKIVQERFASSKPKNFSNDFLLTTLKAVIEKPDVEAHI